MLRNIGSVVTATVILLLASVVGPLAWGQQQTGTGGQQLVFLGIEGKLPAAWLAETPGSNMRLAQYRIPGAPEAQLVVFYFGPGQGGSVEANAARWSSQFTDAQGKQVEPDIRQLRASAPKVTLVELHGNYARGMGMGTDNSIQADHALMAAVVETPEGNAFIQLWGPESTVSDASKDYLDFLQNLKLSEDSQ